MAVILHIDRIGRVIRYKTILLFAVLFQTVMAQENYCHDEETNAYWDAIAIEYIDRLDVANLVKLRKQLCKQVDDGELTVEEATEQFEYERKRVVDGLERGKF